MNYKERRMKLEERGESLLKMFSIIERRYMLIR